MDATREVGKVARGRLFQCLGGHAFVVDAAGVAELVSAGEEKSKRPRFNTDQSSIFDQIVDSKPAPRHHPPEDTEEESAALAQAELGGIRRELLRLGNTIAGVTGDEAVASLGMDDRQTSVRPALSQLVKMGLMEKTRMRRPNRRGNGEIVYRTLSGGADVLDRA